MRRFLVLAGIAVAFQAAQLSAAMFSDDFESGNMSNWTQYPGSAAALAINGPDAAKNRIPVGGMFSARQSALVAGGNGIASYHNFGDESGFIKADVWLFEDLTTSQDPIQAAMTIQTSSAGTPNFSDFFRIGVLQFSGSNSVYSFRTPAGFTQTSVARKSGWTKLGVEIDSLGDGGQARFYIDDALVGTGSRTAANLSVITIGQNFSNFENFWYDGVSVVPEPSSLIIAGLGGMALIGFASRRRRAA